MRTISTAFLGLALSAAVAAQTAKAPPAPPPEPKVKVGSIAPDFTLLDQNRKEVKLSDFRGKKNVVVAFYVFAFTGG
jgi:cytochrome oxidase Cu insertion factor (SCO1/SenC/PrrC family)